MVLSLQSFFVSFFPAFVVTAVLIPVVRALARRKNYVDRPGGRKRHEDAVPPIGGIVLFPVFLVVAAAQGFHGETIWFALAVLFLLAAGFADDALNLPPRAKLAVQLIAAFLIVVPGGAQVAAMGNLFGFGAFGLSWGVIPFSIIAVVLLINAVNLMDGLDGLAGGYGFIVAVFLVYAILSGGVSSPDLLPLLALGGALAGFLVYNMRYPFHARASVFMGDAGSLALGLALAWFCIRLSQDHPAPVLKPASVAWFLALPIYDTCGQFARRVLQRRHPFSADSHHFHHHFLYAGHTPGRATFFILSLVFAIGAFGIAVPALGLPELILGWLWSVLLVLHIYMSLRPHRFRRLLVVLGGWRK